QRSAASEAGRTSAVFCPDPDRWAYLCSLLSLAQGCVVSSITSGVDVPICERRSVMRWELLPMASTRQLESDSHRTPAQGDGGRRRPKRIMPTRHRSLCIYALVKLPPEMTRSVKLRRCDGISRPQT